MIAGVIADAELQIADRARLILHGGVVGGSAQHAAGASIASRIRYPLTECGVAHRGVGQTQLRLVTGEEVRAVDIHIGGGRGIRRRIRLAGCVAAAAGGDGDADNTAVGVDGCNHPGRPTATTAEAERIANLVILSRSGYRDAGQCAGAGGPGEGSAGADAGADAITAGACEVKLPGKIARPAAGRGIQPLEALHRWEWDGAEVAQVPGAAAEFGERMDRGLVDCDARG